MIEPLDLRKYDLEFRDMALKILEAGGYEEFQHPTYKTRRRDRTVRRDGKELLLHFHYYDLGAGNAKLIHNAAHHLHNVMANHGITQGMLVFAAKRPFGFPDFWPFSDGRRISYLGLVELRNLIEKDELRREFEAYLTGVSKQIVDDEVVSITDLSPFDPSRPPIEGETLVSKMKACKLGGLPQSAEFESLCVAAVDLLFADQFSQKTTQYEFKHKRKKIDYLATLNDRKIDGFWLSLRQDFRTRSIVFEFKNSARSIGPSDIDATKHYLFPNALRSVAIIFSRKGANKGAQSQILDILRDEGKLVVVLDFEMIEDMLLGFDRGRDPTRVLQAEIDRMLELINQYGGMPHPK